MVNPQPTVKLDMTVSSPSTKTATHGEQLSLQQARSTGLKRQPTKYPHGLGISIQTVTNNARIATELPTTEQSYSRSSTLRSNLSQPPATTCSSFSSTTVENGCQRKYGLGTVQQSPESLAELQVRRSKYPGNYYLDTPPETPKMALMWLTFGKRYCRWKFVRWPLIFLASVLLFFGLITYCIWLHDVSVARERRQQRLVTDDEANSNATEADQQTTTNTNIIESREELSQMTTHRTTTEQHELHQESTILRAVGTRSHQRPSEQKLTTLEYSDSKGAVYWQKTTKDWKGNNWVTQVPTITPAPDEIALVPAHSIRFTSGHQNSFGVPIEEDERILRLISGLFPQHTSATLPTPSTTLTRVSPTIPPPLQTQKPTAAMSTTRPPSSQDQGCQSTSLAMCRGVLDYDLTYPSAIQLDDTEKADFQRLIVSNCSARAVEFICSTLEPECRPSHIGVLPPCRRICKAILEACSIIIASSDTLTATFDCSFYPESYDAQKCEDPTRRRDYCYDNEFACNDHTCIPASWQCDNIKDCAEGDDEETCIVCEQQDEFRCRSNEKCVPESVRCDLKHDCFDGSDEEDCEDYGSGEEAAFDEEALNSFPRVFSYASFLSPNQTNNNQLFTYITAAANEDGEGSMKIEVHNGTIGASTEEVTNNVPAESTKGLVNFRDSKEIMMTSDTENKFKYSATSRTNRTSSRFATNTTPLQSATTATRSSVNNSPVSSTTAATKAGTPMASCAAHQLRCVSGKCITVAQLCDKKIDCPDGADEQGCVYKERSTTTRGSSHSPATTSRTSTVVDKRTIRTTIKRKVKT